MEHVNVFLRVKKCAANFFHLNAKISRAIRSRCELNTRNGRFEHNDIIGSNRLISDYIVYPINAKIEID